MSLYSAKLIATAREVDAKLARIDPADTLVATLYASILYEALQQERGAESAGEKCVLLDGAIERCRRTLAAPWRMREEIGGVVEFLLDIGDRAPDGVPREAPKVALRLIQGGRAA